MELFTLDLKLLWGVFKWLWNRLKWTVMPLYYPQKPTKTLANSLTTSIRRFQSIKPLWGDVFQIRSFYIMVKKKDQSGHKFGQTNRWFSLNYSTVDSTMEAARMLTMLTKSSVNKSANAIQLLGRKNGFHWLLSLNVSKASKMTFKRQSNATSLHSL